MPGDFVGHLVAFEDVLERRHADPEGLHHAQEGQDFVLAVAVAMDEPGAFDDFHEGLEFKISPDR